MLTPAHVQLIGMLVDGIITAATTLGQVSKMTEEEVKAETEKQEAVSIVLGGRLNAHGSGNPDNPGGIA